MPVENFNRINKIIKPFKVSHSYNILTPNPLAGKAVKILYKMVSSSLNWVQICRRGLKPREASAEYHKPRRLIQTG
jgi:hypothetical protein